MNVSQDNLKEAEAEAQAVLDRSEKERNALFQKYKAEGYAGLDGHNAEYKAITRKALDEIAAIRKKYGIELAPKE